MKRDGFGPLTAGFAGFRVGIRGYFKDYRDSAVRGAGLNAGMMADGTLFIGQADANAAKIDPNAPSRQLQFLAEPAGSGYRITVQAFSPDGKKLGEVSRTDISPDWLAGGVALVCSSGPVRPTPVAQDALDPGFGARRGTEREGNLRFWFKDWKDDRDRHYRVVYPMAQAKGGARDYYYQGVIRKDPAAKLDIIIAAFTGNNDIGFPHADVVRHVSVFKPDLLVFTGDQIYERVGDYGHQRTPLEAATLDYLRKWYLFGWEYRDLLKDIPALCLPDDHDVYHGNLWGAGGRHAEGAGGEGQDKGGYTMPAKWVNMVQRTQTSHLPDPYDPTPVDQGISVYYCSVLYGGVSFAVIEDRKWKSAPRDFLPGADIVNGWAQNRNYDAAKEGDAPGAQLLGRRQLDFLNAWAVDWSGGAWIKAVVSQTIFANVATLPKTEVNDANTPRLRVMRPGEYPEDDLPVMDHDSNGWPQTPRNLALKAIRRGLAFHIAGDQHLASTVQYGIEDWNDAAWALCVPSVANIFPRRWFPPSSGRNQKPGAPKYTGDFLDGFGNKVTVEAVANPTVTGVEPTEIHNRATGYGIVTFHRTSHQITIANWPRWIDPSAADAKPYPGWPITIHQYDNGLTGARFELERIEVSEVKDPVVQVIDQATGETVYAVRIPGSSFTPRVFKEGTYTVLVTQPETNFRQEFKDRRPIKP